jgi:alpha-1,2-mannosyltransferase
VAAAERVSTRGREFAALAVAAAAFPLLGWAFWALVLRLGPNDFNDYWLAGRLILQGHSPYDTAALAALARTQGLSLLLGGGYSYPLPFAVAMVPLALLPFPAAVATFQTASVAAFGLTVAAWLGWAHGRDTEGRGRRAAVAVAAGVYPPVYGSLVMGQANLVLLPVLALGTALILDGATPARRAGGGMLTGLAAIVKLVPAVWIVPLALGRRAAGAVGIIAGMLGSMAVALALAPWAATGSGGLAALLEPDAFYTNQSINGFLTRLVEPSDKTLPLWPGGFEPGPVMAAATALFGMATLLVMWRSREVLATRRGAAIGLGLALVAGVIGAPKESFWNSAIILVAVGLLLVVDAPNLRFGSFGRTDRWLLASWFGSALAWAAVWAVEPPAAGPLSAVVNLAWSFSLAGLLALWWLLVRRLGALQVSAAATIS